MLTPIFNLNFSTQALKKLQRDWQVEVRLEYSQEAAANNTPLPVSDGRAAFRGHCRAKPECPSKLAPRPHQEVQQCGSASALPPRSNMNLRGKSSTM